jgi:hypothetical protein
MDELSAYVAGEGIDLIVMVTHGWGELLLIGIPVRQRSPGAPR